ncbi:DUF1109 domain-containing protein [Glycomyces arizonensis]|uniref:DUF1109 domain-containing protein n=1 Tax=Glycomyces arizonensis TaxID=256035 RepID=UPI000478AD5A|nr:DUF1109 domain-containing protein [Glycomyces arizonensis]
MSNDLPDRLRASAEEFEPDTERMWNRVASGMAEPDAVAAEPVRRRTRIPHLAAATGAIMVLIGAIVFVNYGLNPDVEQVPAGPGPTSQSASPEQTEDAVAPSERPEPVDEVDYLTAGARINGNDNDYWSQSEVTIQADEPVTELTVELHVVIGADVEYTGSWTTSDQYFDPADVFEQDGYLVFRWTLIEGQTMQPGEYILSGQYNHGNGAREVDGDFFIVESVADSGEGTIVGDVEPAT